MGSRTGGSNAEPSYWEIYLKTDGSRSARLSVRTGDQPCFCLCFGLSQMTITRPLRLMILHFSQIGFTEGLTFI